MARRLEIPPSDKDFDVPDGVLPLDAPPRRYVGQYQRLIVNPFLSILVYAATIDIFLNLESGLFHVVYPLVLLSGMVATYCTIQFHCLDCGRSDMFHRWQRHACPAVRERFTYREPLPRHIITSLTQVVVWFVTLLPLVAYIIWANHQV
jgi:hypothetical protein